MAKDLIDKIKEVFQESREFAHSKVELNYDDKNNVVGYIIDRKFENLSNIEAQKNIWSTLEKRLDSSELLRISLILNETPKERAKEYASRENRTSNFWFHMTPELAKYWLFIDVKKFGDKYKSFYIIVCEKNKTNKVLNFVYDRDVLEFMELDQQDEIHYEIFSNTFVNAESEIKLDLMNRYEKLASKHLYGKNNLYWYVYDDFSLQPISANKLFFTDGEIEMIKGRLSKIEDYEIKNDLKKAVEISARINKFKIETQQKSIKSKGV
mgnify:CR=1 FL=1